MEAGLSTRSAGYREAIHQKLADATRRIRWTYSIFWSFSPEQQVLVWGEGYLNCAAADDSTGELNHRRSQQLRNLFNALDANNRPQGVQPSSETSTVTPSGDSISATLRDLTPTERFYVGSMACVFATAGDGLPGQALVGRGPIWHCVSSEGDTLCRVCARGQLAQRARLQTIVCVPASDGVIEFGTTAPVEQDPSLLQQIMQSVFLEHQMHPTLTRISGSTRDRPEKGKQGEIEMRTSRAFQEWKLMAPAIPEFLQQRHQQQMLKTALLTIPRLYPVVQSEVVHVNIAELANRATSEGAQNFRGSSGQQSKHVMAERRRREELNQRFVTLRKIVPFVIKPNKLSLLGGAIEYVMDLERQVKELEATKKSTTVAEKPSKPGVEVTVEKSLAVLKISCAWQDGLLIAILQKMIDLQLEVVDAHAEVSGLNILNATLTAKVRSSDMDINEENDKAAEIIQAALLHTIEGKIRGKEVMS